MTDALELKKESGAGKLYEANGFLVPVLTGSSLEMGIQYGNLMVESMQNAWEVLVAPGRKTDPGPAFDWDRYKRSVTGAAG